MLGTNRKRGWYPLMSLLLMAVLVPVQAAGCCRLASILGMLRETGAEPSHACCLRKAAAGPAGSPAAAIVVARTAAEALAYAKAPAYAAEPSEAPEAAESADAPEAAEPGKTGGHCGAGSRDGSTGCCLEGAPHADPGLVSTGSLAAFSAPARLQVSDGPLPASPSLPALVPPSESGPPVYLACRRLLI